MNEASSLLSYLTSWFGLVNRAGLAAGEKVLIHNGTGGVGYAAIQLARWIGAEVYATAGTPEKRQTLTDLGIKHVYDSRSLAFAQEIRRDTGGRGVDVVLNATSGESVAQSFELLAPFGRFIEIGKKNISENYGLPMRAFQENPSFIAVDIDRLLEGDTSTARKLFVDVEQAFRDGCFSGIPMKTFAISEIVDAFKWMARSNHIGKIAIQFEDQVAPVIPASHHNSRIRPNGNYLVTGGTRGFGLEVAKWLASQGAGKLTLVSRSGANEHTQEAMRSLQRFGAEVDIRAVDISQEGEVKELMASMKSSSVPLRGIFHAAVVLKDDFISQLTQESLESVLRPKLLGATHLHEQTTDWPLDIFFCFSSISALVGNKGQAAYVIANAFLDSLCHFRREQGLAGTSLNWGAISEVGILSRKTDVAAHFKKLGLQSISPEEACEILDRVLESNPVQVGAFRADWSTWAKTSPELANKLTRFRNLFENDSTESSGQSLSALQSQLLSECPENEDLTSHVLNVVLSEVSGLMRISPQKLDANSSISNLGVDSLAAVELGILLRQSVGVDFSAIQLMSGPSPKSLADQIMDKLQLVGAK